MKEPIKNVALRALVYSVVAAARAKEALFAPLTRAGGEEPQPRGQGLVQRLLDRREEQRKRRDLDDRVRRKIDSVWDALG